MAILERLQKVRLLAFDLDGVLTNGKILLSSDGSWLRQMDMKDGFAIQLAVKKGLHLAVISGSNSWQVEERLRKLGVSFIFQDVNDKLLCLQNLSEDLKVHKDEVLYMGDDIPDFAGFAMAGVKVCPADAASELKMQADIITTRNGGDACVREIIEKVMRTQGLWSQYHDISSI